MLPKAMYLNEPQYEDLKKQKAFLEERIDLLPRYEKKKYELKLKLINRRITSYEGLHKEMVLF